MAKNEPFSKITAARTRTAQTIVASDDLLAAYRAIGGLPEDLEGIATNGLAAEAANLGQSTAAASRQGATGTAMDLFEALRDEYAAVMAIVQAVRSNLSRAGASKATLASIDGILVNEVPVRMVAAGDPAAGKKKARKVESFEAIRAEVQKDALALVDVKEALPQLARRTVTEARLKALAKSAADLAGKVGERSASKGAAKAATASEYAAVAAQTELWGAVYRLLASLGRKDARVRQLLTDAAR